MKLGWFAGLAMIPLAAAAVDPAPPAAASSANSPGLAAAVTNATAPPAKASDIAACMARNVADRGSVRDVVVTTTDREGKSKSLKLKLHWKPTKDGQGRLNLRVAEPLMLAGSSYLLLQGASGEEIYFYLPAAKRTQKVAGGDLSRPLWGTDFSYNDVKMIQGILVQGDTERQADGKIGNRDAYLLLTKPAPGASPYPRVVTAVDRESCVILRADFYGKSEALEKSFSADLSTLSHLDPFSRPEPYWFVRSYTMQDAKAKTSTKLELSDIYLEERMPEKVFDPEHFFEPFE
jgi:hypothetical protein